MLTVNENEKSTEARRAAIVQYVVSKGTVSVLQLSQEFNVSAVTIRADLTALEKAGHLQRRHGGATISTLSLPGEIAFQSRAKINQEAKQRIGLAAASLVNDGDSILIDSSTTGFYVARFLRDRVDLKVVTNGINTALELLRNGHSPILIGGMLNEKTYGTVGALGRNTLASIRVQKAFIGARGVSIREGLTDTNLLEVELKRAMVEITSELIAIVDSSKLNVIGFSAFAPISKVSTIITDEGIPSDLKQSFENEGIRVIIA